jgi:hypothetical protein
MTDAAHPDIVELPVGTDVGTIEIVMARLQADGIVATVEPDLSSLSGADEEGFRLIVHRDDLEAVLPVLKAAGIEVEV